MNITKQSHITQSEQLILSEGVKARQNGNCINENPYPAVCQQSLRDHWVWKQGWYQAEEVAA